MLLRINIMFYSSELLAMPQFTLFTDILFKQKGEIQHFLSVANEIHIFMRTSTLGSFDGQSHSHKQSLTPQTDHKQAN